jgi:hypothetical protein
VDGIAVRGMDLPVNASVSRPLGNCNSSRPPFNGPPAVSSLSVLARRQAETPLIALFRFPEPALAANLALYNTLTRSEPRLIQKL